ncbi:cis-Golgi t-SNARE syntaxin, partial [Cladochytrium tenue]
MASSSIRNRTAEFHSAIDSMLSRTAGNGSVSRSNAAERSRLVMRDTATPSSSSASPTSSRSEFARKAALINREIVGMSNSLHRLAQLARKKSLFDDQPAEIGRLIAVVKAKIPEISRLIGELADARKGQAPGAAAASTSSSSSSSSSPSAAALARNRQVDEHSSNVITSLQAKLATSSSKFKSILEVRTQAMRDQKSRRDQYSMSPAPSALPVVAGAGPSAATTASTAASSGIAGSGPLARPAVGSVMASLAAVGPRTSLSA